VVYHVQAYSYYFSSNFRFCKRGEVGITLVSMWREPYSKSYDDVQAAGRAMDFMLGWLVTRKYDPHTYSL